MYILYLDQLQVFVNSYSQSVQEGDNIQICLQSHGIVTKSVHFQVETTQTTEYITHAAIGKTDIVLNIMHM